MARHRSFGVHRGLDCSHPGQGGSRGRGARPWHRQRPASPDRRRWAQAGPRRRRRHQRPRRARARSRRARGYSCRSPRRAPGTVLQGGPGPRRRGQRRRHYEPVRGGPAPRSEGTDRLRELCGRVRRRRRDVYANDHLWGLQDRERRLSAALLAGEPGG